MDAAGEFLDLMTAVGALHRSLVEVGEAVAAAAGLSHARAQCLRQVADTPRTVAEIAARLDLARQGVQRVADVLVDDGLAGYTDNPRHRRAKLLTITDAGRRALAGTAAAHERWVAGTAPALAGLDLPGLAARLRAVQAAVAAAEPPSAPTGAAASPTERDASAQRSGPRGGNRSSRAGRPVPGSAP
jgi:DNA-binding MarR family transcriptional regulator